jgi:outer membrane protein OmpA-like peptidoglycan-associated protein
MIVRSWLPALLLLGSTFCCPISFAQEAPLKLAQECIAAKITTQAGCDALLKKLGKLDHKADDKSKGAKQAGPAGHALLQACVDAGVATQAACDAFEANEKARQRTSPPPQKLASPAPASGTAHPAENPPQTLAPTNSPKTRVLAKDCLASGITTPEACDALHATHARPELPATSKQAPAPAGAKSEAPRLAAPRLSKDCVAAKLTTQADCDALHATGRAKQKAFPDVESPASGAKTGAQSPTTPAPRSASSALGITKAGTLSKDCIAAGLKTQADCDALLMMEKAKGKAPSAAPAPNATPGQTNSATNPLPLAPDCIAAGMKSEADCTAYQLAKSRSATSPGRSVPAAGHGSGQPREVIPVLPKGVSQAQVAPLLDSARQGKVATANQAAPAPAPATPPPSSDKSAQASVRPTVPPPLEKQAGTPIPTTNRRALVTLPTDVTIVNQTIVNNITTNVTTNVTNNSLPRPVMQQAPPPPNPIGLSIGVVLQLGNGQLFVDSSGRDQFRIAYQDRDTTTYDQLSMQRYRETIVRPDGTRIVTIYDRDGDILRRSRFEPDGQQVVLAYYDYTDDPDLGRWRDPGDDLPPLQLQIPVDDYALDADQADEQQIQLCLSRPPVEPLRRLYSISEVERSARLRDIMPRVELGDLTFDTGSADLGADQISELSSVANAMLALLRANPAETFLIEGHTDAVGSDASNLVLSDARAASVAQILTQAYHIPPENLATQGYGDHFLRIQTDGPERLNRRVVIRRITPLIAAASAS